MHCRKHLLGQSKEKDDAAQPASLAQLDELLPSIQHTCIMEHGFWKHGSATGQVDSILKDYEAVSVMLCAMFKFVRDTSQKKQVDVAPADLKKWIESLPKRLPDWIGEELSQQVQDQYLKICEGKQQALASEGLAAIGQVVDQCLAKTVPALSAEEQQHMLLNIPRGKEVKGLAASFLEAFSFGPSCLHNVGEHDHGLQILWLTRKKGLIPGHPFVQLPVLTCLCVITCIIPPCAQQTPHQVISHTPSCAQEKIVVTVSFMCILYIIIVLIFKHCNIVID